MILHIMYLLIHLISRKGKKVSNSRLSEVLIFHYRYNIYINISHFVLNLYKDVQHVSIV